MEANNNNVNNPGQNGREPLMNMRDRLFHTLFFRLSLAYARSCPRQFRRMLECFLLLKAILCMLLLVYIHLVYTRHPVQCLEHIASSWPRDGILRVEIVKGPPDDYNIDQSYQKERNIALKHRELDHFGALLFSTILARNSDYSNKVELSDDHTDEANIVEENVEDKVDEVEIVNDKIWEEIRNIPSDLVTFKERWKKSNQSDLDAISTLTSTLDNMKDRLANVQEMLKDKNQDDISGTQSNLVTGSQTSKIKTVIVNMTDQQADTKEQVEPTELKSDVSDLEKFTKIVWSEDEYIVEYSLEIGFLRLSPSTRQKLNISVHIEVLDPTTNQCFGNTFSRFLLENFLGYDDVLMSSIKSLAEKEENKGYLRNVVTGAQYHFVSRWSSSTSYVAAAMVMMVFTVSISMLLRYSQHQIFVFILDLLQMMEFNTNITIPAAPLLTVILALVGMEAIMSEFFEDTTTAFYVILMVWLCDQYDAICCHTNITRRYWLRFFYLYHTAFYAYHYRFSGQYSSLALLTMWLFTQHSMVYFYHHYELPVIMQQAQIRDILDRGTADGATQRAADGGRRVARPRMRGFTLGGFRFRFGIVFHTVHQQPAPVPPPVADPENEVVAGVREAMAEPEDLNVQLRRYVAEVEASATALDQLHRDGAMELGGDQTSNQEEDFLAEVDGREASEEEEEEIVGQVEPEQVQECNDSKESSQECSRVVTENLGDSDMVEEISEITEDHMHTSSSSSIPLSDLQEIRENLLTASQEAQELLREIEDQ